MSWKKQIISSLHERDLNQKIPFEDIVNDYLMFYRNTAQLCRENQGLHNELKGCRQENADLSMKLEKINLSKSYDYEQKVFRLQEEVTDLHRQKGALAADVIDLNKQLQEREKLAHQINARLSQLETSQKLLQDANCSLTHQIDNLEQTNQLLEEEKRSVRSCNQTLEEKVKQIEDDRVQLIKKLTELQATVEKLKNIEYDQNYRKTREAIQKNLQEAANEPSLTTPMPPVSVLPRDVLAKFDDNEGDINCVRFTPSGKWFGSAGFDRKLRLRSCVNDEFELLTTLVGCNASIAAIDFDPQEIVALAASSDFSCRIWTLKDSRLRFNLTGHSDRVVAAKFMGSRDNVVTASSDRTIKIWDVNSCQCKRTLMTASTAQDVVPCTYLNTVVSGHFDGHLRLWDERSKQPSFVVSLSGRVTGLEIIPDQAIVVACTKTDTVELVNLQQRRVVKQLTADGFRVGLDIVRPCFSPDARYVAAGSHDGSIHIWDVDTGKVETVLREHTNTVVCCHWGRSGYLVSCERNAKTVLWGHR